MVQQKRFSPLYHISITFPDGKKLSKSNVNLSTLFDTYFINLDKNIKGKNYSTNDAESIMDKYSKLFENCKVVI